MDRAAKLAAEARKCLREEARELADCAKESRKATREELGRVALELGYSKRRKLSSAIDQALKDAGTTP